MQKEAKRKSTISSSLRRVTRSIILYASGENRVHRNLATFSRRKLETKV
jgi:hypothetical protein